MQIRGSGLTPVPKSCTRVRLRGSPVSGTREALLDGRSGRAPIEPLVVGRRPDSDDPKVAAALSGAVFAFNIAFEDISCDCCRISFAQREVLL